MIIYGTRTLSSKDRQVTFHCPTCSGPRHGSIVSQRRWFTLYFIPIFPVYSQGEHAECGSCGGTYETSILNYDPTAEQAATRLNFRLLLVMGLAASGRTGPQYMEAVQKAYFDLFEETIPLAQLETDLQNARSSGSDYRDVFLLKGRDFSDRGRQLLTQMVAQILSAAGPLQENDKEIVRQIGVTFKLPKPFVDSVFTSIVPNLYS